MGVYVALKIIPSSFCGIFVYFSILDTKHLRTQRKKLIKNIDKKYVLWVLGVIIWNYGFPIVPPLYDVIMAILLKHILA